MSDNPNFFNEAKQELEDYIQNRILLAKMQVADKVSDKVAAGAFMTMLGVLLVFVLIFGGIMTAYYLTDLTGSLVKGFGYVAAFFLGLAVLVLIFRKAIAGGVRNSIIKNLFK
ncbi:MAG: hypothetical protein RI983_835 [Bacteroidota bacterium]|jgi:hypothetical protein